MAGCGQEQPLGSRRRIFSIADARGARTSIEFGDEVARRAAVRAQTAAARLRTQEASVRAKWKATETPKHHGGLREASD